MFGLTLTTKDLDQIFIQESKDSPRKLENVVKDRSLCRYEFIDILMRMALKKYMSKKESNTYIGAIDKFLEQDFFPNVKSADYSYEGYRYEKIHTEPVDQVLRAHEQLLKGMMNRFANGQEAIKLEEVENLLNKGNFGINHAELLKCFSLSKMMVVDEREPGNNSKMMFVIVINL